MSATCLLRFLLLCAAGMAWAQEAPPPRIRPPGIIAPDPVQVQDWPQRIARLDPGSLNEAWAQPEFDHAEWKTMRLPAHWESAGLPDYDGVVWFRREIELNGQQAEQPAVLGLGAIDDMDVTWVNGKRVGGHEKAGDHFTPRNYEVPAGLLKAGRNVIAVRVMDHGYGGGLAQTHSRMELRLGPDAIPLSGAWRYRPGASLARLMEASNRDGQGSPPPAPWAGRFELRPHEVVAFAGGTNIVKQCEAGYLEAMLTRLTPHPVYFRSLAWQADTVHLQQRPLNFGTHLALLDRINATVVVANFGQMEALEGTTKLPEFLAAYDQLLDQFAQRTPRIVLVGPHRFERPENPLLPDLSARNGDVVAYNEGIRQLAERRGLLFVDLAALDQPGLTSNGVHFNERGQREWARAVALQLTGQAVPDNRLTAGELVGTIRRKNHLWHQHWRPTNWSFLYGDRQHVPSSHDHRPGMPRWFPEEVNALIPLIEKAEDEIQTRKEGPP